MNKDKFIKIGVAGIMLGLVVFSGWMWWKMRQITQVLNTQGNYIMTQAAEWQVVTSTFSETDKKNFINAVNQVLKDAQQPK